MPKNLLTILPELDEFGLRWALWFSILHAEGKADNYACPSPEAERLYRRYVNDIPSMRRQVAFCDREKFTKFMYRQWPKKPPSLQPLFKVLDGEDSA